MALRNSPAAWGAIARAFHWSGAALMAGLLAHGWWMTHLAPREARLDHYYWHGVIGFYFAALLAFRMAARIVDPAPHPPEGAKRGELWSARAGHVALYVLMIAATATGWVLYGNFARRAEVWLFGVVPVPYLFAVPDRALFRRFEGVHEQLSHVLLVLIAIHVLAALRHHFVKRNDVLRRMWRRAA